MDRSRNDRIELRIGPALDTLRGLPDGEHVDFAFVDADKKEYREYFEAILSRLHPGGIIVSDNVFRHGDVVDTRRNAAAAAGDEDVAAMHTFNTGLLSDCRVDVVILTFLDRDHAVAWGQGQLETTTDSGQT